MSDTNGGVDHAKFMASRHKWRRVFSFVLMVCIIALAVVTYQAILWQRARAISNYKTAVVAAEAASVSHIATILMSETGVIIKSNAPADDMLSSGENAEGKNIHDFCVDPADREKAVAGMRSWYRGSPVGAVKAVNVVMALPEGNKAIIVIATSIKPGVAGDIAFKADLIYRDRYTYTDIIHNKPTEAEKP